MNTPTNNPLTHTYAMEHGLDTKNKLINFLNQHGYRERYGNPLYYRIYSRELPRIWEFLDELQWEELRNWMMNIETEQTTQKPHDERKREYDRKIAQKKSIKTISILVLKN